MGESALPIRVQVPALRLRESRLDTGGATEGAKGTGNVRTMIEKRTWQEFKGIGLLWWVNRVLHLFGWAIVFEYDSDTGKLLEVYPARCKFRGFSEDVEADGFIRLSGYLGDQGRELEEEAIGA